MRKSPSIVSLYGVHRVTIKPSDEMKEMFEKTQATLEEINETLKKLAGKDERTGEIIKVIGSNTSKKIVAFRTFLRCIETGIIKIPGPDGDKELDTMYSTFFQEVEEGVC